MFTNTMKSKLQNLQILHIYGGYIHIIRNMYGLAFDYVPPQSANNSNYLDKGEFNLNLQNRLPYVWLEASKNRTY